MSVTTSPILNRWDKEGRAYNIIHQPSITPLQIPANGQIFLPIGQPDAFVSPEGVIINLGACFDNPLCGIRISTIQGLDTGVLSTIQNATIIGVPNTGLPVTIAVPPVSAPGFFCLNNSKEWPFKVRLRLSLLNTDVVAHTCLILSYTVALLDKSEKITPMPHLKV